MFDLNDYPDFTNLLNNAGYDVKMGIKGHADVPVLLIKHRSVPSWSMVPGKNEATYSPSSFQKWLDEVTKDIGLQKGFVLRPSDLQAWEFGIDEDGTWRKKVGDKIIVLHPTGVYGGELVTVRDNYDFDIPAEKLFGPFNSLGNLEFELRNRGWVGVKSEPLQ